MELVRDFRVAPEKSNRRFRIGLADNLFAKAIRSPEMKPSGEGLNPELEVEERSSEDQIGFSRTEIAVGLAAIAGLALGYLIGKRRK